MHTKKKEKKHLVNLTDNLMLEVASGNEEAFTTLYNITSTAIYSYILSIVKNTHLSEDFMQDTYLSIRRAILQYNPRGKPMAWIFTIARNHIYTYFRNQKENVEYNDDSIPKDVVASIEETSLENVVLQTALQVLNENERTIVILNVVAGYKFKEISKNLQLPLGTVLSNYHRGILKLKKALKEVIE